MDRWRRVARNALMVGAGLELALGTGCSGTSSLEHQGGPESGATSGAAGSRVAAGGATSSGGSMGRAGRGGRPSVGGGGSAGDAGETGDAGRAGESGSAGDGNGAVGGSGPARGGSAGLGNGGQGGPSFGGCGYLRLDESEVCDTASDRYTHVPEAADLAACEAACTESDDCAGISWTESAVRCGLVSATCPGVSVPMPGAPRVYSRVCDDGGSCELVEVGAECADDPPWIVEGATDLAACEDACLTSPNCEGLLTYFELGRPPGCYLASHCSRPEDRRELAQRSYRRVCDLLYESALRPPPRLALGRRHSCLLLANGSAECWGASVHVIYSDSQDDSYVSAEALGLDGGPFTRLAATDYNTCGIGPDHAATCSTGPGFLDLADLDGSNAGGFQALRIDGRVNSGSTTGWVRAASGTYVGCWLAQDGHAECGGYTSPDVKVVTPTDEFVRIAAGSRFACGVHPDGTLKCWGSDSSGQASPPTGTFTNVTAGSDHACALKADGTVACWGGNGLGQATPPAGHFTEVVAAFDHTCAIPRESTDKVTCWGDDDSFQSSPPAILRTDATPFAQWVVGGSAAFEGIRWTEDTAEGDPAHYWGAGALTAHGCGLAHDGSIQCFGTAGEPPSGSGFTELSAGVGSTCAVSTAGIECWGEPHRHNAWGGPQESPLNGVSLAGDFTQVSTGWDLACAVRDDATIICWGLAASGPLAPSGQFSSVSAGGAHQRWQRHACGVRDDGSITCWSYVNYSGEMGVPYDVAGSFQSVSVGYSTDCALDLNGYLSCWDSGAGPAYPLPVPPGQFTRVVSGDGQACALTATGRIECFTLVESFDRVALDGTYEGPFVDVSMGGDFACGLLADGTPRCWGSYVH